MNKQNRADQRKFHFIYKTTNIINGKYYIGMHSTDNIGDGYIGSGTRLWSSIKHYGIENFKVEILEFLLDRKSLKDRERVLVNKEQLTDKMCMNLKIGGEGGFTLSTQVLKARNLKCQEKRLEKLKNDPILQKQFSDECAAKNRKFNPERNKRLNPIRNQIIHLGSKRSQKTKDKMSSSGSGDKNSMFGKAWIYNEELKISKRVIKEDVEFHLSLGWKSGRKMKF